MTLTLTDSAARGLATFDPSEQTRLRAIWAEHGIGPSMVAYLETRDPTELPAPAWPDVIVYQPPRREPWSLPTRVDARASELRRRPVVELRELARRRGMSGWAFVAKDDLARRIAEDEQKAAQEPPKGDGRD